MDTEGEGHAFEIDMFEWSYGMGDRRLSSFSLLPADKPASHAHVLESKGIYDDSMLIPGHDAVATWLYKYDPHVLEQFLDRSIVDISLNLCTRKGPKYGDCGNVCVERRDNIITVSSPVISFFCNELNHDYSSATTRWSKTSENSTLASNTRSRIPESGNSVRADVASCARSR